MKRGGPLKRTGRLRARSKRTETVYRTQRRPLVARLLADDAVCARCQQARATEVHERLSRARGGSITDEANCVPLCHDCHHEVTTNPAAAEAAGWSLSQYGRTA